MMDCGKKTWIVLTLCALVIGAERFQQIKNHLEVLVSVPSTHIGDTDIATAVFTSSAKNPFRYTVGVQKNETKCSNSSDRLCTSMIQEPKVEVSLTLRASNGKSLTYSNSINESLRLVMHVDPEISVSPEIVDGESDGFTISLDVMYNRATTSLGSLRASRTSTVFSLNAEFITTTTMIEEDDKGQGNGQSPLCCGPLIPLILLALLPGFLLK
ncbi:uncharacterized protein LOC142659835 [Rhinoderma darwinii]|uniref:uncharacterized protein LOC142659835 n=1 Tax=Rhinoderma darwinii TaxID=43563 RepID=UPI003F67C755